MKSIVNTVTALLKPSREDQAVEKESFDVCMLSDIGCRRSENEDRVLYVNPGEKKLWQQKGILAIVADGMGGHQAGQVASQMAIDLVSDDYYKLSGKPLDRLKKAFRNANQIIFRAALEDDNLKGMGTTCSALVFVKGQAFVAHIGDSRLYRIRDNSIEQMSEDHTIVYEMVKQGILSEEQARTHPDKNIVTRAMGTKSEVNIFTRCLSGVLSDDRYVLCSDGLHDLVREEEIMETALSGRPHEACEMLISKARERGGHDNISVGVVHISQERPNACKTMVSTRF